MHAQMHALLTQDTSTHHPQSTQPAKGWLQFNLPNPMTMVPQ